MTEKKRKSLSIIQFAPRSAEVGLTAQRLRKADAVIIATDHSDYDYDWIARTASLVVDTRNAVKKPFPSVIKA